MKCEIIDGQLVVKPTTVTEEWAFKRWIEEIPSWRSVHEFVIPAPTSELVVQNNLPEGE